jgi:hypothetical protein
MNQRDRVAWSEYATAGKDIGGPLRRHEREAARLHAENLRLRLLLAAARDGREAALEAYVELRSARPEREQR